RTIADKDDDFAVEDLFQLLPGGVDQELRAGDLAELLGQSEERGGSTLNLLGSAELILDPRSQRADGNADDKHHGKGQEVLRVIDREREIWGDKEEVEDQNAGH